MYNTIQHFALLTTVFWATAIAASEDNTSVHLLVYETDATFAKETPLLQQQQQHNGNLQISNVGMGDEFVGFGSKYTAVLPRLKNLPATDIVIISDGRDVLLNRPMVSGDNNDDLMVQHFVETFHSLVGDRPAVVVSAEAQCCVSALTYAAPGDYFDALDGSRTHRACFSGKSDCMWNGDEHALPWENFMKDLAKEHNAEVSREDIYLNAGLMVGRATDLIRVITKAAIGDDEDDQAVLTGYMYHYPDEIILDYDQALFGNNRDTCMFELHDNNRLVHKQTKMTPLLIHTPGGTATCHEELMNELGQTQLSSSIRRRLSQWNKKNHNYKDNNKKNDDDDDDDDDDKKKNNDNKCSNGFKRKSGYCVKEWCKADYSCPRNSVRKPGRECYNNHDDCQCKAGYYMHKKGFCKRNWAW